MNYIASSLSQNEKLIYSGKLSRWYFIPRCFYGTCLIVGAAFFYELTHIFIVALLLFALGCVSLLIETLQYWTREMAVTNKRVIYKVGLFTLETAEIPCNKIESIDVDQSFLGRLMNFGNIRIAGIGASSIAFNGIIDPLKFKTAVLDQCEK